MRQITITIDGPVASGKGITAKLVAEKLQYRYLDTGALYRAIAFHLLNHGIESIHDISLILNSFDSLNIEFTIQGDTVVNNQVVNDEIRSPRVSKYSSVFAVVPEVRAFCDKIQKALVADGGWVMDGRDSGSVVAPHAELKIYLDCEVNERARRRALDRNVTDPKGIEEIKQEIIERDTRDMSTERGDAQLRVLPEATVVDTTQLTIDQQVEIIYQMALEKISE